MSSKNRRKKFLAQHHRCCFCGGSTPATTIDHVPARALFLKRHWPETYEFPACDPCNQSSKTSEIVVAAISRCAPDPANAEELAELRNLVEGIRNNDAATLDEMTDPAFKAGIARQATSLILPQSSVEDLPILRIGPLVHAHLDVFAAKLAKALHYLHTGNIVSERARLYKSVYSNANVRLNGLPVASAELPATPALERNTKKLNDQFHYRYGVTTDKRASQFTASFRQSFIVAMLINDRIDA